MPKFFFFFCLLLLLLLPPTFAQNPEDRESEKNPYLKNNSSESLDLLQRYYQRQKSRPDQVSRPGIESASESLRPFSTAALAMEGPIDPLAYVVGPADVLTITLGGLSTFSYAGPVTPEGLLVIPTVGEVAVAGTTLGAAKKIIQEAVRRKYNTGDIGVHLYSMRTFRVTVVGAVATPGTYTVSPVDRVDRVVALADFDAEAKAQKRRAEREKTPEFFQIEEKPPTPISLRNIKLYRASGDTLEVDLVRYYAIGETSRNPYLRDGDVVFVPAENLAGNSVSIYGGVRQPGVFEFHEGDSLSTLLRLAQGPTALADLERVEVVRFLSAGRQAKIIPVNLQPGQNGHTPDMPLQRNDRIFIREDREKRQERMIYVYGAVARPGEYAILYERTMLSEVIERAGGFKPDASIAEARLIRKYNSPDELRKNPDYVRLLEARLMDLKPSDREYFDYEVALRRGFVAVDFVKLFQQREKSADVEVLENDEIYVPTLHQTINVTGQVINPGYVTYLGGVDYRYYLEKAGGFSKEADRKKVRIIKRDTNAWLKPGETVLEPGDQIFVSRLVRRSAVVYWNTFRDVLQTTASLAAVYLLYRQVAK